MKLLKKKVKENTTITLNKSGEKSDLKRGNNIEHFNKHNALPIAPKNDVIGFSKGVTLNMGDYQSLRVDAWITSEVNEGETVQQAYERLEKLVEEQLEISVNSTKLD